MGIILLIMQIIGAIPAFIEGVKWLLDRINRIQNKRERAYAKARLRSILFRRRNMKYKTMSQVEKEELESELADLKAEVDDIINKEGGKL